MPTEISDYLLRRIGEGAEKMSGRKSSKDPIYWQAIGIRNLKRKLLGLCANTAVKYHDEVARLFVDMNITDSYSEGSGFVEALDGMKLLYGFDSEICFSKVSKEGAEMIRIDKRKTVSQSYRLSPYANEPVY